MRRGQSNGTQAIEGKEILLLRSVGSRLSGALPLDERKISVFGIDCFGYILCGAHKGDGVAAIEASSWCHWFVPWGLAPGREVWS